MEWNTAPAKPASQRKAKIIEALPGMREMQRYQRATNRPDGRPDSCERTPANANDAATTRGPEQNPVLLVLALLAMVSFTARHSRSLAV